MKLCDRCRQPIGYLARECPFCHAKTHIGAGDVVAAATSAVGIKPCGACQRRREAMNRAMPEVRPWAEGDDDADEAPNLRSAPRLQARVGQAEPNPRPV